MSSRRNGTNVLMSIMWNLQKSFVLCREGELTKESALMNQNARSYNRRTRSTSNSN